MPSQGQPNVLPSWGGGGPFFCFIPPSLGAKYEF